MRNLKIIDLKESRLIWGFVEILDSIPELWEHRIAQGAPSMPRQILTSTQAIMMNTELLPYWR